MTIDEKYQELMASIAKTESRIKKAEDILTRNASVIDGKLVEIKVAINRATAES